MAIQIQRSFPNYGIIAPAAYVKVSNLKIHETQIRGQWTLSWVASIYFSAATRNANKAPLEKLYYSNTYSANDELATNKNAVCLAYEYMEGLSEFNNGISV